MVILALSITLPRSVLTILAGNFETQRVGNFFVATTGECDGTIISSGNNLMENYDTSHCTVIGNPLLADPKLSPLQNNGGPTQTHALLTGSPAIDGENSTGCRDQLSALLLTDQRGAERHLDGDGNGSARCDIGAVEFGIVPGALDFSDFDGDGKADFAVYNSATAGWSIIRSSDGGLTYKAWGGPGWEPVPADYDGDGKADIAVYNASNGLWSIVRSSDGGNTLVGLGGGPQDIPLN